MAPKNPPDRGCQAIRARRVAAQIPNGATVMGRSWWGIATDAEGAMMTTTDRVTCHYCDCVDLAAMRPYGPGGSWLCFPCMKATPERESAAHAALGALLDGAAAISTTGAISIGEHTGPRPFDPQEASDV